VARWSLTEQDISAPPFGRHRLGAFWRWDISALAVTVTDVSALALYAAAAAAATLHSVTNNTSGS